jgi:hypothetical protein
MADTRRRAGCLLFNRAGASPIRKPGRAFARRACTMGFQAGAKQHGENALELYGKGQIIGIFRLALGRAAPSGSLKMTEFLMDPTRP